MTTTTALDITPGEWKLYTDSEEHGEYTIFTGESKDSADAVVAEISGGLGVTDDGCFESLANARLIREAPAMLAALIEARNFLSDRQDPDDNEEDHLVSMLNSVIAKVSG